MTILDPSRKAAAQSPPPRPAPFPPMCCSRLEFQRRAADELDRLSLSATSKCQRAFHKLANQLRTCGTTFYGRKCTCGQVSGIIACVCGLKICPACEQYRSRRLVARLLRIVRVFRGSVSYVDLHLVTFSLRSDLAGDVDLSIDGLRVRRTLLQDAISGLWAGALKSLSAENRRPGMVVATEVSPNGGLRAHAVLVCRRLDASTLSTLRLGRYGRSLFVDVDTVSPDMLKAGNTAISEIARHVCNGNPAEKREVLYGTSAEHTNPRLAARAEYAFFGRRIFDTFGVFRGLLDAEDVGHRPAMSDKCPRCSADGL